MPSHTKKPGHAEKRKKGCFLPFFRNHDINDALRDTCHDTVMTAAMTASDSVTERMTPFEVVS